MFYYIHSISIKNPNVFECAVEAVCLLLHQNGQIWELVNFSTALIYFSGKILADIKIRPGSDEEALQFDLRKKTIGSEMMLQKISQMMALVLRDNTHPGFRASASGAHLGRAQIRQCHTLVTLCQGLIS